VITGGNECGEHSEACASANSRHKCGYERSEVGLTTLTIVVCQNGDGLAVVVGSLSLDATD
jgi:hypothetical protein